MTSNHTSNQSLVGRTVLVAGGTGNVGGFIVRSLLEGGAVVAVPSRSPERLRELRDRLATTLAPASLARLRSFTADIGTESGAGALAREIAGSIGRLDAVIASLGRFLAAPPVTKASVSQLRTALDDYVIAHFTLARAFLPRLEEAGGTYLFINGPLAFEPWRGSGAGLVSIATAAQQMLFRVAAQEADGSGVRVVELVSHAFVRDHQTQPGSPIPAEAVGSYAAHLVAGGAEGLHGRSIQLRSLDQLHEAGLAGEAA